MPALEHPKWKTPFAWCLPVWVAECVFSSDSEFFSRWGLKFKFFSSPSQPPNPLRSEWFRVWCDTNAGNSSWIFKNKMGFFLRLLNEILKNINFVHHSNQFEAKHAKIKLLCNATYSSSHNLFFSSCWSLKNKNHIHYFLFQAILNVGKVWGERGNFFTLPILTMSACSSKTKK